MKVNYEAKIILSGNDFIPVTLSNGNEVIEYLNRYAEEHHLTPEEMTMKNFKLTSDVSIKFTE